jgi:type II secretory pathway component PulF
MPAYEYWATTEIGDTVSGKVTAASPDAVAHLLTLRGWTVRRLEELAEPAPPVDDPVALTGEDFEAVASQLETITQRKLPLVASLRTLAEESRNPRLRAAVSTVIAALEQGQSLDESLSRLRSAFPRRMGVLFDAGAKTGRLPFLLQEAINHLYDVADLRRKVWLNLAYPLFLAGIALLLCGSLIFGIVPTFASIFQDFGISLPALTVALINVSRFGAGRAMFVAAVVLALVGGAVLALTYVRGRSWWHAALCRLPLVGTLFRTASLSGFFRMLAVLVETGFSLPEAFRIAGAVNDDAGLSARAEQVANDLEHGISPLDAVRVTEAFPRETLPVFRWSDQPQLFMEALQGASDIYAARSRMNSGVLAIVLEPVLMFAIGLGVGLIVIALFLPLIKLLNDLA